MSEPVGAYGQDHELTLVDRFGVWLSARRLGKEAGGFTGKRVADVGCGYDATFVRSVLDTVDHATLVDVALAPDLRAATKVTAIEGALPDALSGVPSRSIEVVMCISVLEHLWDADLALREMRRIVADDGVVLLNVPSWRGKRMLELSAFRLGMSPPESVDDHKRYYDPKDLWPRLVAAGFRPRDIRCFKHKFGLNTFATCHAGEAATPPGEL